ncbi:hypothetical protein [Bacillus thuringiensis]|nr:hypothetical protein [Bacillus thuringiensis]
MDEEKTAICSKVIVATLLSSTVKTLFGKMMVVCYVCECSITNH